MTGIRAFLLAASLAGAAQAAEPAKPLFAGDAPLQLTIRGPLNELSRSAERSPATRSGSLQHGAENLAVMLSPRGITRRRKETCQFPPLRVEFAQPPAATSVFAGQRRLKLVTHCRPGEGFQQYVLLEYAAYRLYNLLSPASFRARLATIDYVEADGRPLTRRVGFFIEDADDAARRNGMREANVGPRIPVARLGPADAARFAVFQYMIGNLDWAMQAGPPGNNCCHNSRLIGAQGGASPVLVPMPYDFDFAGLVDAPYATPPEAVKVSSVKVRRYRGFCRDNALALAAVADFRARRGEIMGVLGQIPGLSQGTHRKASAYLDRFFADIASDASVQDKLLKTCLSG